MLPDLGTGGSVSVQGHAVNTFVLLSFGQLMPRRAGGDLISISGV